MVFFGNIFSKKLKKNFDKFVMGGKVLEIFKIMFSKKHFQKKQFFQKKRNFFLKNKVLVYQGKKFFFPTKKHFFLKTEK